MVTGSWRDEPDPFDLCLTTWECSYQMVKMDKVEAGSAFYPTFFVLYSGMNVDLPACNPKKLCPRLTRGFSNVFAKNLDECSFFHNLSPKKQVKINDSLQDN